MTFEFIEAILKASMVVAVAVIFLCLVAIFGWMGATVLSLLFAGFVFSFYMAGREKDAP